MRKASDIFTEMEELIAGLRKFRVDIEKALEYGNSSHGFDDIALKALTGEVDTYILPNSVIIMELDASPKHKSYHAFIAAGDLDEIIEAQNGLLIREAKYRNAKYLTLAGRRGWAKVLEKHGWTEQLVVMSKEIDYG